LKGTLYESEFDAQMERAFRPWRCVGIFLLRCLILFAELCLLTALLYWVNRVVSVASWLRICTAIALLIWASFAWSALKARVNVYVRSRPLRFAAKCVVILTLLLLVSVALQITFPP
jgi:succinate dehydrogenase hydrophobic anchor subunit